MQQDIWNRLEEQFDEFPDMRAEEQVVFDGELQELSDDLGIAFPADYVEFIKRYGGAVVGAYEIVGLRRAEFMDVDFETVADLTMHFRNQGWPNTGEWIVFTTDQGANPIGLDKDGMVWLSDHDHGQIVAICRTFEEFLRTWCLSSGTVKYYVELPWPESRPPKRLTE